MTTEQARAIGLHEYKQPVTRFETFHVSDHDLQLERTFQAGKRDRLAGKPCASANGAYLNGWYNPKTPFYYITRHAAHLLAA